VTGPSIATIPFAIDISQRDLDDLHERLGHTRWPAPAPGAGWERGVPVDYLRELAMYWQDGYDWRAQERRLNVYPQFLTTIDGQRLHFLHVRSRHETAFPLVLTHGWPGSIVEFLDILGPLTDPTAHGGVVEDAFHVVVPSLPGFGFSGPVSEPGWDVGRIAAALATLMNGLGYDRYCAQGGDWGSAISRELGILDPEHVVGVHLNMLTTPLDRLQDSTDDDVQRNLAAATRYRRELSGYQRLQATRPQTLAYALTDSPVGQLAWIVERFVEWSDPASLTSGALDRDEVLTNVMIYWLTATAGSSAGLYYEQAHSQHRQGPSTTPTAVAVFPHDLTYPLRRVAEHSDAIERWTEFDRGGHFAAMEVPDLLVNDIRAFFRSYR
jgi:pimeloyl-ACP methyl ester carboxylesterase